MAAQRSHWQARWRRFRTTSPRRQCQIIVNRLERRQGASKILSGPLRIDIIPTYRCNLRCVGCVHYQSEGPKDLDLDLFSRILNETAANTIQYKFCSIGEPFMNRHVPEMMAMAAKRGVGFLLVTNGTLVTPELADHLVSNTRTDVLTFSVDGATAETCEGLRRGLKFEKLLGGINSVVEAKRRHGKTRPVVQANFVAMRDNSPELPDLIRLAAKIGIDDVNVNYLTIEGETDKDNSLFEQPSLQKEIFAAARAASIETGVALHLPPDLDDGTWRNKCFFPWDTMIIDTDGTARLCYFSWEETIGNVVTDGGVRAVWNNAILQKVRETIESDRPFYRYCSDCGRRVGFSQMAANLGKNKENAERFEFDWDRGDAPRQAGGKKLLNPDIKE